MHFRYVDLIRSLSSVLLVQEMFMASSLISCGCSSMGAIRLRQIIYFWGTMLTVVSRASKQYAAFSSHTRSNTRKTFFFSGVTMNVLPLIVYMGFMMSARGGLISAFGKHLLIALTACLLLLLLMKRSSACMGDCHPT